MKQNSLSSRLVPFVLIGCLLPAAPSSADEIDRLLAAVNGQVITAGDLDVARTLNALVLPGASQSRQSSDVELDRLVDLDLIRQELANFPLEEADESMIRSRMEELRSAYAEIGGLTALLRRLGLQETELRAYVRLQISIERFIDLRFRPFVSVSTPEVEAYYRGTLTPELHRQGVAVPPLSEVSPEIEAILKEEKVNTAMNQWIANIRSHSRVEFFAGGAAGEVRP